MALNTTDGSKTLYAFFPEAAGAPGVPVAGAYQTLRSKTGVKFDLKRDTFVSKDRRADRMESSMSYGNKSGTFTIPIEWSYGTYDALMEAVMGSTWATDTLVIGNGVKTFTFEETSKELSINEAMLGCQFGGMSISQKSNGIADGDFSGVFRDIDIAQTSGVNLTYTLSTKKITRASSGFITTDGWAVGDGVLGLGNAAGGNNNTIPWVITALTETDMTFTVAASMVDAATPTAGITLNKATKATSLALATTIAPFDSFTGTITEGGNVIAHVTGWDMKVDQTVTPNFACGSPSAQSVSVGTIKVTGNLTVYYIDQALRKKFINGTQSALILTLGPFGVSKSYNFALGTVKYTSNSRDDAEMARTESLAFTATYDATNLSTLKITRYP